MKTIKVRLTFLEPLLGTWPANPMWPGSTLPANPRTPAASRTR